MVEKMKFTKSVTGNCLHTERDQAEITGQSRHMTFRRALSR